MKKIKFLAISFATMFIVACSSSETKEESSAAPSSAAPAAKATALSEYEIAAQKMIELDKSGTQAEREAFLDKLMEKYGENIEAEAYQKIEEAYNKLRGTALDAMDYSEDILNTAKELEDMYEDSDIDGYDYDNISDDIETLNNTLEYSEDILNAAKELEDMYEDMGF